MTDQEQFDDQMRQKAHAQEVRDRRNPPEQNQARDAEVKRLVAEEVKKQLAAFTIQGANGIRVSGSGPNITISQDKAKFTGTGQCVAGGGIVLTITEA